MHIARKCSYCMHNYIPTIIPAMLCFVSPRNKPKGSYLCHNTSQAREAPSLYLLRMTTPETCRTCALLEIYPRTSKLRDPASAYAIQRYFNTNLSLIFIFGRTSTLNKGEWRSEIEFCSV